MYKFYTNLRYKCFKIQYIYEIYNQLKQLNAF